MITLKQNDKIIINIIIIIILKTVIIEKLIFILYADKHVHTDIPKFCAFKRNWSPLKIKKTWKMIV